MWTADAAGQQRAAGREGPQEAQGRTARLQERLQSRDASARKYKVRGVWACRLCGPTLSFHAGPLMMACACTLHGHWDITL